MASIWDLPVIFVCENNQYAESTPVTKAMRIKNIADRAVGYGIPGVVVDGTDVTAVYQEAEKAVNRARQGKGPTLLECKTYRYESHEIGDPWQTYRTKEEVEAWKARDPIPHLKKTLISSNILTEKDIEKMEQEVMKQLDEAITFAETSSDPDPDSALRDIFVEPYY